MPDRPAGCRPAPPTKRGTYHWLLIPVLGCVPATWDAGVWCVPLRGAMTPEDAAFCGWRYVGPCVPPPEINAAADAAMKAVAEESAA